MSAPLKQVLREHFERESLSPTQLGQLQTLLGVAPPQPSRRRVLRYVAGLAVAALVLVMVGIWRLLPVSFDDPRLRVADEIALNHLAGKPLDIVSADLGVLRPHFARLEFALIGSAEVVRQSWQLDGGRYCSVQTIPAAQLRYRRSDGAAVTVYQAPYRPALHGELAELSTGEPPYVAEVRGVVVHLWVERGLLLATATDGTPLGGE